MYQLLITLLFLILQTTKMGGDGIRIHFSCFLVTLTKGVLFVNKLPFKNIVGFAIRLVGYTSMRTVMLLAIDLIQTLHLYV